MSAQLIVVTGGAASGKSAHAERILCSRASGRRIYLATMEPFGQAAAARIARHRALRAGKGFETVERTHDLAGLTLAPCDGLLLEDLPNLLAGEWFSPVGAGPDGAEAAILRGIAHLREQCRTMVVVAGESFSDGQPYPPETRAYLAALGRLHTALAAQADGFYESVCGILCTIKEEKTR